MSGKNFFKNGNLTDLNKNNLGEFDEDNCEFNENEINPEEDYDAFNEETFASNLNDEDVGDWEAEHDHLLEIENNQFSNEPLSKLQITPPKIKTPPRESSIDKTPEAKPTPLVKILPNVKTLEEIEAELLSNSSTSANTSLAESTKSRNHQESELFRKFPQLAGVVISPEEKANPQNHGLSNGNEKRASQLYASNLESIDQNKNELKLPENNYLDPHPKYQSLHVVDPNSGMINNQFSNQLKNVMFSFDGVSRNYNNFPIGQLPAHKEKILETMQMQRQQPYQQINQNDSLKNLFKNMMNLNTNNNSPRNNNIGNRMPNSDVNYEFLRLARAQEEFSGKTKPFTSLNHQQKTPSKENQMDRLRGMMTDKEKNWVVSVQMLQLQNDDPYSYDFYYTAWMLKKKNMNAQNSQLSGLKTLLNQNTNKNDLKSYRPLTFENSLGKVTMSNFHHPRALIDVNSKSLDNIQLNNSSLFSQIESIEEDGDRPREKKNLSTILLEIEQMYLVYLNVDEIEHRILKEPGEMRANLFQERRLKVDKLASMMCSENFAHYLFVAKGRRLLGKCIPTFNSIHTKQILAYFMQYIYVISKNNISLDEIYAQISYAVDTQKFNDITEILIQFNQIYTKQSVQVFKTIFSNKFALTFLLKFFSKSEMIVQDDYDQEIKLIWSLFLNNVLNGLNTLIIDDESNLRSAVYETYILNKNTVFDNFSVNLELWNKSEQKLKDLFVFSSL